LPTARRDEQVSLTLLKLDPNNVVSLNNLAVAEWGLGESLWAAGRLQEAMPHYLKQLDYMGRASAGGADFSIIRSYVMAGVARRQAELGDSAAAAATVAAGAPFLMKLHRSEPAGSLAVVIGDAMGKFPQAAVAFARDDALTARRIAGETVSELQAVTPRGGQQEFAKNFVLHFAYRAEGRAAYQLGDFVAAERSEVKALEARKAQGGEGTDDQRQMAELSTWIAMAQARQGRMSDAEIGRAHV